jgi:hypothetical protein
VKASTFVRISFKPHGATRKRTCWAKKTDRKPGDRIVSYWRVDKYGEEPEPRELIMGIAGQITERPAIMNKHYAMLELATETEELKI